MAVIWAAPLATKLGWPKARVLFLDGSSLLTEITVI